MIELFGFVPSRSNRPHWALEEIGAEYRFYTIDLRKGDHRSPYFLAINPAGKSPAMRDGDLVLTESGAICNYIGEKYPESGLTPQSGTPERALYDQWMYFALTELEQPLWTAAKHTFAIPEEHRVPAVIPSAKWEFARAGGILAGGLGDREFLVGDRFTMADIMVAHTLMWAVKTDFPLEHANLGTYLERMKSRPALKRVFECPRLELPKE